jgi:hypothetical protein
MMARIYNGGADATVSVLSACAGVRQQAIQIDVASLSKDKRHSWKDNALSQITQGVSKGATHGTPRCCSCSRSVRAPAQTCAGIRAEVRHAVYYPTNPS